MCETTEVIKKDGPHGFVRVTTIIDTSKPKCYREGHEWKFNSEIIVEKINE